MPIRPVFLSERPWPSSLRSRLCCFALMATGVVAIAQHVATTTKPSPVASRPVAQQFPGYITVSGAGTRAYRQFLILSERLVTNTPVVLTLGRSSWWLDEEGRAHVATNGRAPAIRFTEYVLGVVSNGVEVEVVRARKALP